MPLGQGPDGVHQALRPAVVALREELVQRVVLGEGHVLQVARHPEQHGVTGPGVDAGDHHRVGADPGAVGAGVGAEQQDVDAGRAGPGVGHGAVGVGLVHAGGARRDVLAGGEQAADDVALDGDVAHHLHGRRQHEQAHQDREGRRRPSLATAQVLGPGAPRGPDDGGAPDHGPDDHRDAGRDEHVGPHGELQGGAHHPVAHEQDGQGGEAAEEEHDEGHTGAAAPGQREPEPRDDGAKGGGAEEAAEPGAAGVARPLGTATPRRFVVAGQVGHAGLSWDDTALKDGAPPPHSACERQGMPTRTTSGMAKRFAIL